MQKTPLILDVKGNSLDDGPGIRTVVFFKGCPSPVYGAITRKVKKRLLKFRLIKLSVLPDRNI